MQSQIPLPTDNIYKFYALFGLLLFVFSFASIIYITSTTNELIFQTAVEIETINVISKPTDLDLAKKAVLEKRREIAVVDRKGFNFVLDGLAAGAVFLMFYGFRKWHKYVQPVQDEMAQLQLRKLRHEVEQLTDVVPTAESAKDISEGGS